MFLDSSGGLARRLPMRQMLTSWTSLYGATRRHFPVEHYHQSAELTDFRQSAERVEARFGDGREVTGGLLVAADGGGSFVRGRLMPEVRADYAGYVAWRGLVDEPELTDQAAALLRDRFSASSNTRTRTCWPILCVASMRRSSRASAATIGSGIVARRSTI